MAARAKVAQEIRLRFFAAQYSGPCRFNAAAAAQAVGHRGSSRSLCVTGARLLKHPIVIDELRRLALKTEVTAEEIHQILAEQMRTSAEALLTIDKHGPRLDLAKAQQLGALGSIEEITETSRRVGESVQRTIRVKLYSRRHAAWCLAKLLGLVVKKEIHAQVKTPGNLTDEQIIELYQQLGVPLEKWIPGVRRRWEARQRRQVQNQIVQQSTNGTTTHGGELPSMKCSVG